MHYVSNYGDFAAHRTPYIENPPNQNVVFEAREHRKKMNMLFGVIREIIIYVFYLTVVAVLAYENRDPNAYQTFTGINNIFVQPATVRHKNFINVSTIQCNSYM